MKTKLPIKSGGSFITNSNLDLILFTENQAKTFIKKLIAEKNKQYKTIKHPYRCKLLSITKHNGYFTYSSI